MLIPEMGDINKEHLLNACDVLGAWHLAVPLKCLFAHHTGKSCEFWEGRDSSCLGTRSSPCLACRKCLIFVETMSE